MNDDNIQKLAIRHSELFQKSGDFDFSAPDGWYNIIDVLCHLISHNVNSLKTKLKYSQENPDAKFIKPVEEIEKELEEALEALPTLVQVKEKFGGLRFYTDGSTPEIENYITFAESMSYRTCEVCGAPGERRNTGWVSTLCDTHYSEEKKRNS